MKGLPKLQRSFVGPHLHTLTLFDVDPVSRKNKIRSIDSDIKISYNRSMDEEEELDTYTETIMPFIRIYVSAGKEDHDLLEVEEVVDFLTSEQRSISDTIKDLLDQGILNVYACSFNQTMKVF